LGINEYFGGHKMGFSRMDLGFFFIFFDFNFDKINILPDLLGYILIYLGVSQLISRMANHYFSFLKKTCVLLISLTALDMLIKYSFLNGVINNPATIQGKGFLILFIVMIFHFVA
jgi:hypothetical protein